MLKAFASSRNKLLIELRHSVQPVIIGLLGGTAAVVFQVIIRWLYLYLWLIPSHLIIWQFAALSLSVILVSALIGGALIAYYSRDAAGSGIPQLKKIFWLDFGYAAPRVLIAKFIGGIVTIGGGMSLGREGPTVHIAATLASNVAGWFGVPKQNRRPALLAGAAAGLAAAFNTPLSAITFVLEEITEDLNDTRYFAFTLIAAVTATFTAHLFLGDNPAFIIPSVSQFNWSLYILVIPVAVAAAAVGAGFQKVTLLWRDQIKTVRLPLMLKPGVGAAINWLLGFTVFALVSRLGVFGLGYEDLEDLLHNRIALLPAVLLLVGKFWATTSAYAWQGAGGIFAPTLFLGAATGLVTCDLLSHLTGLTAQDRTALIVAAMSACLGAVVKAPITSILIVFEMTHQFAFVPLLMIGTIASQSVSRLICQQNFYSEILHRDGVHLEQHMPARTWRLLQARSIGSIASYSPVIATTLDKRELASMVQTNSYRFFPLVLNGQLAGIVGRESILTGPGGVVISSPVDSIAPDATIQEASHLLVNSSHNFLVLVGASDHSVVGVVTLHDILRAQARTLDQS